MGSYDSFGEVGISPLILVLLHPTAIKDIEKIAIKIYFITKLYHH